MSESTSELLPLIRACTLCSPDIEPRPVVQADADAKILIAGQAPGRVVHESGVPFDDKSGDRLRSWLGLSRDQFYDPTLVAIVPMGFCFPGSAKGGDKPPRPECAEAWHARLLGSLTNLELTVVIGRYAVNYHLEDRRPLTEVVKASIDELPHRIALPHPSPRNLRWFKNNPWFERRVLPKLAARVRQIVKAHDGG